MGPAKTAKQMGVSAEDAERILNDFYTKFPRIKEWVSENEEFVKKNGYVEDFWGRRRRLPDAVLPENEFKNLNEKFNPLLGASGFSNEVDKKIVDDLKYKLSQCRSKKQRDAVNEYAKSIGVEIINNSGYISKSMRQATNARIQGSAATMTKKAMINIYNDEELKRYDFKMLIGVHDEIIGECRSEYAKQAGERLAYLMRSCVPEVNVPFKCDAEIENEDYSFTSRWYGNEYSHIILDEYSKLLKAGKLEDEARQTIINNHSEMLENELIEILDKG